VHILWRECFVFFFFFLLNENTVVTNLLLRW
jgi:hypothetical protein